MILFMKVLLLGNTLRALREDSVEEQEQRELC